MGDLYYYCYQCKNTSQGSPNRCIACGGNITSPSRVSEGSFTDNIEPIRTTKTQMLLDLLERIETLEKQIKWLVNDLGILKDKVN